MSKSKRAAHNQRRAKRRAIKSRAAVRAAKSADAADWQAKSAQRRHAADIGSAALLLVVNIVAELRHDDDFERADAITRCIKIRKQAGLSAEAAAHELLTVALVDLMDGYEDDDDNPGDGEGDDSQCDDSQSDDDTVPSEVDAQ